MIAKGIQNQTGEGSITVFLSLILLVILSLIFTIIEGARVNTAKVFAERSLSTAMDSVLAEYYGPLWEEYHIFGYDTGSNNATDSKKLIENKLADYMSYTIDPNKGLDERKQSMDLYDIALDSVSISEQTMLMDYKAELLISEAVDYSKYNTIGNGIEQLLDKCSLLETPKKVSVIYDEKQKAEDQLSELDEEILRLMQLLDGVKTGNKGIALNSEGHLQIEKHFIKKLCFEEVSKESVGINQDHVFQALKREYVNPAANFQTIKDNFVWLESKIILIEQLKKQRDGAAENLSALCGRLESLNSIDIKSQVAKLQIKKLSEEIQSIEEVLEDYNSEIEDEKKSSKRIVSNIQSMSSDILLLVNTKISLINEASDAINLILRKAALAEPLIKNYEETLIREKENLDEVIYKGLDEDLKELKRYISQVDGKYNFFGMLKILNQDLSILLQTMYHLNAGSDWIIRESEVSLRNLQCGRESFQAAFDYIKDYQIRGLTLDYSTLVLEKADKPNPFGKVNELLDSGITSLIMDPALISKSELSDKGLPSMIAAMTQEKPNNLSILSNYFKFSSMGGRNYSVKSPFGELGSSSDVMTKLGNSINLIAEHVLYQEYIREHFKTYVERENINSKKPSALTYEQEYLLVGKVTDQENLNAMLQRLLVLRTICNFVSILGDKDKVSEAKLAAASLVGFTGLPILISVTQTVLLLIWSCAEALLDISALTMGKEVPIIKKNILIQFQELFMINRSYLQTKASKITTSKELSFAYDDYLRVFLLMKRKEDIAYRSLDLMQVNIRLRYAADEYQIMNTMFGFQAKASFRISPRLTGLRYIQRYIGSSGKDFGFSTVAEYSY